MHKVFIEKSIKRYAKSMIESGFWKKKEALKEAKRVYRKSAYKSSVYDFYTIYNEDNKIVGYLWLIKDRKILFVAELYVRKKYRHQGYGRAILKKVDKKAKKLNYEKIGLNVATHNKIAQSLYAQCGFEALSEFRMKRV